MKIKPIRTKRDYEATLKEIEGLMDATRNSRDGDRLDVLVTLVEAYEAQTLCFGPAGTPWKRSSTPWNNAI